ncbi:MAG: hypothetical protein P8Y54_15305 [Xanthomonadales bacterium]
MKFVWLIIAITFLMVALIFAGVVSAENEYTKYTGPEQEKVLAELNVSPETWTFSVFVDEAENVYSIPASEVVRDDNRILCGEDIVLSAEGLSFPDVFISNDDIKKLDINSLRTFLNTIPTR